MTVDVEESILQQAESHYGAGRLSESEALFTQLLNGELRASALHGIGMIALARGNFEDAAARLGESLIADPQNAAALYYLGWLSEQHGSRERAISHYGEALAVDPTHAASLSALVALAGHGSEPAQTQPSSERSSHNQQPQQTEEGLPPQVLGPPNPPRATNSTVGVVKGLRQQMAPWRGRPAAVQLWTFRLETLSPSGQPTSIQAVELRGNEIHGDLQDGDWVEVVGRTESGRGLRPRELNNLTTNGQVRVKRNLLWAT